MPSKAGNTKLKRGVDVPRPANNRSAVANGSRLFVEEIDGRSAIARRYRDLVAEFTSDIGGDPTEAQKQLIRRAASLSTWAEAQEVKLANGEDIEIGPLTTAANSLRRILQDIGLERRSRDVTPTLEGYMAHATRVAAE